jgi:hypothetical protein
MSEMSFPAARLENSSSAGQVSSMIPELVGQFETLEPSTVFKSSLISNLLTTVSAEVDQTLDLAIGLEGAYRASRCGEGQSRVLSST